MKLSSIAACVLTLAFLLAALEGCSDDKPRLVAVGEPLGRQSCTIFAASFGNTVLFGNNEDYINLNVHYWVMPAGDGKYSTFCVGFDDVKPQGGMNEKGLCFDGNALPIAPLNLHPELPRPPPGISLIKLVMQNCATVQDVIDLIKRYSWAEQINCQIFFADATGDMMVASAAPDGEWAFTRPAVSTDKFLVSTNFNVANTANGKYPCQRYNAATTLLEQIKSERDVTVPNFRTVLNATHQEGVPYGTSGVVNTVYSNIFNPGTGEIYIYYHHQFDEVAKLNLTQELAKGTKDASIADLFSEQTVDKAMAEYQAYAGNPTLYLDKALNPSQIPSLYIAGDDFWRGNWWIVAGAVGGVLVIAGIGLLLIRKTRRKTEDDTLSR